MSCCGGGGGESAEFYSSQDHSTLFSWLTNHQEEADHLSSVRRGRWVESLQTLGLIQPAVDSVIFSTWLMPGTSWYVGLRVVQQTLYESTAAFEFLQEQPNHFMYTHLIQILRPVEKFH